MIESIRVNLFRIALANIPFAESPDDSVARATQAIAQAARQRAAILCFPECYIPGLRGAGKPVPPPDVAFLHRAHCAIAAAAAEADIAVVMGTERIADDGSLLATALVVDRQGTVAGFQDKVQLDPSEDAIYSPGAQRRLFHAGPLTFGIAICHEGWRYPETVRWAALRGAQVVFHPHFSAAEPGSHRPTRFADPANTFHEKAILCRAAENTCYFASANYAEPGSPTTSAIAAPHGSLLAYQPYGAHGLLIADLDLDLATCALAKRCRSV